METKVIHLPAKGKITHRMAYVNVGEGVFFNSRDVILGLYQSKANKADLDSIIEWFEHYHNEAIGNI